MPDIAPILLGHALMIYACVSLVSVWAWGAKRGVSESLMTVFGLAVPVGAWALSIAKPVALWAAPASIAVLYLLSVKPRAELIEALRSERLADRAAAEDRAISSPDDGAARMTLARVAELEGRFDDALDHYEAAHRLSDTMFPAGELEAARDRVESLRIEAGRRSGLAAHPVDAAVLALSALLCLVSPARGLAPLSAVLFSLWTREGFGAE